MDAIREIMQKYNNGEVSLEDTNKALAPYGIHLDPEKNPDGGWTEAEMAEGFIPGEPATPVVKLEDFRTRIPALAGKTITVKVEEGTFKISYNEDGYHIKSVRM